MSKGLGKLQLFMLETLNADTWGKPFPCTTKDFYDNVISEYWDKPIHTQQYKFRECWHKYYRPEDMPEVKRRRASIAQSLRSLKDKSYVGMLEGILFITDQGKEVLKSRIHKTKNKQP